MVSLLFALALLVSVGATFTRRDDLMSGPTGSDYSDTTPNSAVNCDFAEEYYTTTNGVSWASNSSKWVKVLRKTTIAGLTSAATKGAEAVGEEFGGPVGGAIAGFTVGHVTGFVLNKIWPGQNYDNGLQNQLNCQLNSLIDGNDVARQVYQGELSQNLYQIKYWGFQYQSATLNDERITALDQAIGWCANSYLVIKNASPISQQYSLMPAMVIVGQLHLTFLREQYLYRLQLQNQTANGFQGCSLAGQPLDATDCAVYNANQYGKQLQTAYDSYYDYFNTTYPLWRSWRRSQMVCQKSSSSKKAWALGDVYSNTAAVGDVSAWYYHNDNGDTARDSICSATADLRMELISNYMIGMLDPVHYFHQYVPWMSQASSSCQPCLQQCFSGGRCNRTTADGDMPACTSDYQGVSAPTSCNIRCSQCTQNCSDYCATVGWSLNSPQCQSCFSGCASSDACSNDCVSCYQDCESTCLNCNINARYFPFSEKYQVALFSGTLDNTNLDKGNPTLQAWTLNTNVQPGDHSTDPEGLITNVTIWVRTSTGQTVLGYHGLYYKRGTLYPGKYNEYLESDAFAYSILPNPRRMYSWLNNVTFTQQQDDAWHFKICDGGCGVSQAPKFRGFNMNSPNQDVDTQLPDSMSSTLNTAGILANFSSSPEYMITQSYTGYYPYVTEQMSSSQRALSSIGWNFRHWISATKAFASISFPAIPSSNYTPQVQAGDFHGALFPPQNLGQCDTRDIFPRSSGSGGAAPLPTQVAVPQPVGEGVCGYEVGSECELTAELPCCASAAVCKRHASACGKSKGTERYRCVNLPEQLITSPAPQLPGIGNGSFVQSPFYSPCAVPLEPEEPGFPWCD